MTKQTINLRNLGVFNIATTVALEDCAHNVIHRFAFMYVVCTSMYTVA